MASTTILLNWVDLSMTELGFKVYKSTEPFDVDNLPPVLITLPPDSQSYSDTSVEYGETYYYMASVFNETDESFSPLKKVICREDIMFSGTSTDFHMLDSTGDPFDVFKTNVRFPGVSSDVIQTDVYGNYYVIETISSTHGISKYNSEFNKEWTIGLSGISQTYFDIGLDGRLYVYTRYAVRNRHGSLIATNGLFVFDKDGGYITHVDVATVTTGRAILAISPDPEIVYLHNGVSNLSRVDLRDGSVISTSVSNNVNSVHDLFVDRNFNLYFCGSNIIRYSHDLEQMVTFANGANYAGGVITNDGTKIIAASNSNLRVYDAMSLELEETVSLPGRIHGIVIDSNNDIYVNITNSYVIKLDGETYSTLWTYTPANGGVHPNLLMKPGRLYHNLSLSGVKGEPL